MTEKEREILGITQEECAEVIQAISKCVRFGIDNSHKSGNTQRENLSMEVGDLICMIGLLIESGLVKEEDINRAKQEKIEKLKVYSSIFK
jgi:NTP pyrophosphatase (non-canonical NTP hydrolase)|tara:strand:+ start:239 stop:508 length:270 start_codon:yes stop_codon:yes gene_type:complete